MLSLVMLGVSFYFYNSNDVTERKSRLMRYIKKELEYKSLPTNVFDKKIENDRYLLTKTNFNVPLIQTVNFSKCLTETDAIYDKEMIIDCARKLNKKLIEQIGEEVIIKAIAHSYFTSGLKYLTLGNDIQTKKFHERTEDNTDYLKLISYSGFLYNLRDSKKLANFYNKHKPLLQIYISKNVYNTYLASPINNLLIAYQKIENATNKAVFIQNTYNKAEETYSHADVENWSITFWNRRSLEKNDEIIYHILKDVKHYYDNK